MMVKKLPHGIKGCPQRYSLQYYKQDMCFVMQVAGAQPTRTLRVVAGSGHTSLSPSDAATVWFISLTNLIVSFIRNISLPHLVLIVSGSRQRELKVQNAHERCWCCCNLVHVLLYCSLRSLLSWTVCLLLQFLVIQISISYFKVDLVTYFVTTKTPPDLFRYCTTNIT